MGSGRRDLVAAGLYDPAAPDAAERGSRCLTYLTDEIGVSIPELVQAPKRWRAAELRRGPQPAPRRRALDPRRGRRARAASIPSSPPRSGARRASPTRGRSSAASTPATSRCSSWSATSPRSSAATTASSSLRTMGESIARIAEAEIALLRSNIEAPLAAHRAVRRRRAQLRRRGRAAVPRASPNVIDVFHRHQIELIGRRYSDVGAPTSSRERRRARSRVRRHRGLHRTVAPARSRRARGDARRASRRRPAT